MERNKAKTTLVVFGISGDLSRRYVLPALEEMGRAGVLPHNFKVLGVTRKRDLRLSDLLGSRKKSKYLSGRLEILVMDTEKEVEYPKLSRRLAGIEGRSSRLARRLFYLSVPPSAVPGIVEKLGKHGLRKARGKLLLEKPFGTDLASARVLAKKISRYFREEEIYRIDHYLAKEAAQNILVFRAGNALLRRTWDRRFIERIEVLASEKLGVEGRVFYEEIGALRDYVSSHLLGLLSLILSDLPKNFSLKNVATLRLKALSRLWTVGFKMGQYAGYRREVGNPKSRTETFVSVDLRSSDPKWKGVPITLATGKALAERLTEIRIYYRGNGEGEPNELVLRIQPEAGIRFSMLAKCPGHERKTATHILGFRFEDHYDKLPDAYEHVLLSAFLGDHAFFPSSAEILESWRILAPVQRAQKKSTPPFIYPKGEKIETLISRLQTTE